MFSIPDRDEPCWNDAAWRTAKLRSLKEHYGLTWPEIARMLDASNIATRAWGSGRHRTIDKPTLRHFMLELKFARR